jgi:hypothetical protein
MVRYSRWHEEGDPPEGPRVGPPPSMRPAKRPEPVFIERPPFGQSRSPILRKIMLQEMKLDPKIRKSHLLMIIERHGFVNYNLKIVMEVRNELKRELGQR